MTKRTATHRGYAKGCKASIPSGMHNCYLRETARWWVDCTTGMRWRKEDGSEVGTSWPSYRLLIDTIEKLDREVRCGS